MRQLVFKDKEKVLTTTKEGKILFPHNDIKDMKFDDITIIDDFEIAYEKEKYGFFIGNKVNMVLPQYKELIPYFNAIYNLLDVTGSKLYETKNFYIIETSKYNTVIGKDEATDNIIITTEFKVETAEDCNGLEKFNSKYYAIHNATAEFRCNLDTDLFLFEIGSKMEVEPLTAEEFAIIGMTAIDEIHSHYYSDDPTAIYTDRGIFLKLPYSTKVIVKIPNAIIVRSIDTDIDLKCLFGKKIDKEVYQSAIYDSISKGYALDSRRPKAEYFDDKYDWEGYQEALDHRNLLCKPADYKVKADVCFFNLNEADAIEKLDADTYDKIHKFVMRSIQEADVYLKKLVKNHVKDIRVIQDHNYKQYFKLTL